jgi:hypothetical protein
MLAAAVAILALTSGVGPSFDCARAATPVEKAAYSSKFVPPGWTVEETVRGDLNGDGVADHVLMLVEAGSNVRSTTPGPARMLIVLLERRDGTLEKVGESRSLLLCTVCFGALGGGPRLSVQEQQLVVEQERGSRTTVSGTWRFTFDAKAGRLRLVRLDVLSRDRVEGTTELESIDYLTGAHRKESRLHDEKAGEEVTLKSTMTAVDTAPQYLEDVDATGLD